jgi:hypothetical protein
MGTISWGCDLHRQGYRSYTLRFDATESTATETLTLRVGRPGKVVLSRVIDSGRVAFPRTDSPFRQVEVSQGTEPGTLRAVVKVDFRGRPVSPSHCWPYLPPALTVRLFPR